MTKNFWTYLKWATIQHGAVIGVVSLVVWIFPINMGQKWILAMSLFALAHWPNFLLMLITYMFAMAFYPFVFESFWLLIPMIVIHAAGGTLLKKVGFDLRVWKNHPKWPKGF
jgi:hypothetical protein